ncbi:MAG: 2-oxoglutarate dehydrogenase E1 component [Planctomycetaceae bacterium]|nr:2-oxoglutarate dehydrogenase E1 component [Planctomycetaceae bacterium]
MAQTGASTDGSHPHAPQSVNGWQSDYIESLFAQFKANPDAVPAEWQNFFRGFELGLATDASGAPAAPTSIPVHATSTATTATTATTTTTVIQGLDPDQRKVDELILRYRTFGHLATQLDPLGTTRPFPEMLTLEAVGLDDGALSKSFDPGSLPLDHPSTLGEIISCLEQTYCGTMGVEYMHIGCAERRAWIAKRIEGTRNRPSFSPDQKKRILSKLLEADSFENFLANRYVGKKRFGLEGGESLIPMLDAVLETGPALGVQEFTLGMAHRGRLNVLANIVGKNLQQIFTEFDEAWTAAFASGGGDVKYHMGYSNEHATSTGQKLRVVLAANPSHLEFVNSVVLGRCRGKQRLLGDEARKAVVPVIVHGDSAFPGQGIVAECFNMMLLDGYTVGGTIHFIVNNQVGFTTNPRDTFGSQYGTDLAKGYDCPVIHVNGDDAEACAWAARLAMEWRQTFGHDIVVDMWCYRKSGHNETDEPMFTQPLLYQRVKKARPAFRTYRAKLVAEGVLTDADVEAMLAARVATMDEAQTAAKKQPIDPVIDPFKNVWAGVSGQYSHEPVQTGVSSETLESLAKKLAQSPDHATVHKTVARLLESRAGAVASGQIDWALAELLAYASLLAEGHPVRLSGQDVERGTFSHRHAVVNCQDTNEGFCSLNALSDKQARFCVHNSPLTESAVLGFEYGYSLGDPRMLVIWEAQFGDFANGAQVIVDQFIASGEAKWKRSTGLVMLLPHGYEGQGPEHSSARLERFLQLCADDNMQVVYPTTSAQVFHLIRKQVKQGFRKPLVVMTPKSMLRLPAAVSRVEGFVHGHFRQVLPDVGVAKGAEEAVNKVLLCSGKIYHELAAQREKSGQTTTAIVRLEQVYPFPDGALTKVLAMYPNAKKFAWVQEEPRNMGAYRFAQAQLKELMGIDVDYVGRPDCASPAVGSQKQHAIEQDKILTEAIGAAKAGDGPAGGPGSKKETAHK